MAFEYKMLVLMTFIFLVAWLPSSLAKWHSYGGKWLASNRRPVLDKELPQWGQRAERAHNNLKDYFPGFVVAILLLGSLNKFDVYTAWASGLYVLGRVGHLAAYIGGNVLLRSLTFFLSMGCNFYLLIKVVN
jgi:uncharacterized MAPEG superfamily protein